MAWTSLEGNGSHAIYRETVANDSDKTLTVTSDLSVSHIIRPQLIEIFYEATATVGTRLLRLVVSRASGDVLTFALSANTNPTADDSIRIFLVRGLSTVQAAVTTDNHLHAMPPFTLGQGDSMRIYDSAAIAATADDMTLVVHADKIAG